MSASNLSLRQRLQSTWLYVPAHVRSWPFGLGLLLRLGLMAAVVPLAPAQWYVPFIEALLASPSADPWGHWLAAGGDPLAFPYGWAMALLLLPGVGLASALGAPPMWGYVLTLLAGDVLLLEALRRLSPGPAGPRRDGQIVLLYWLSPLVIVVNYLLGLNDLLAIGTLCWALVALRAHRAQAAGLLLGAALSIKLSMVVALPFVLFYLYNNRPLRDLLRPMVLALLTSLTLLTLPSALSPGARTMLAGNPEMTKIFQLTLSLGPTIAVYVVPLLYLVGCYLVWRMRRFSFDQLFTVIGVAFLVIVLLSPASPGWFVWAVPLLVVYQLTSDRTAVLLAAGFSALFVLYTLLSIPLMPLTLGHLAALDNAELLGPFRAQIGLVQTGMVAFGVIFAARIVRERTAQSDVYRFSRRPYLIGIGGDSGSGKDTLVTALTGLFGPAAVTHVSGDNYHLWDRHQPMWKVMTHLNPLANDLERFTHDVLALAQRRAVRARHYDHAVGKMSHLERVESNDVVLCSGLHALYAPTLLRAYQLSIFLDIDEGLRRHFKVQRDVHQRGHTLERVLGSIAKREGDATRYIHPQARQADLVFAVQPVSPEGLRLDGAPTPQQPRLQLLVRARRQLNELSLTRALVSCCGITSSAHPSDDPRETVLTFSGEGLAADYALAARQVCPRALELLDRQPQWADGVLGLMQLIVLSQVNQQLSTTTEAMGL